MAKIDQEITNFVVGDDLTVERTYTGLPFNVIFDTAWLTIKRRIKDEDEDAIVQVIVGANSQDAGQITKANSSTDGVVKVKFNIFQTQTAEFKPENPYVYDVQFKTDQGAIHTFEIGTITLVRGVTDSPVPNPPLPPPAIVPYVLSFNGETGDVVLDAAGIAEILGYVPAAGGGILTGTAGAILGGQRAVRFSGGQIVYADNTQAEANAVVGITNGAAASGSPVNVILAGEMSEPSWTWTPLLPIYLSTNGLLTQTAPTSGALVELGIALTATKMLVRIQQAIYLS